MSFELFDLKQVRVIRAKLGINRKELADYIGVTPNMITKIEIGKHKLSWDKAGKMLEYFKTKVGQPKGFVEDICTKEPYTLRFSDKVSTAKKKMLENEWDCIPITDNEGNLKGKITTVIIGNISKESNLKEITIGRIMEESPPTVPYNTPTKRITRFLTPPDCVIVTKKGKIFGIVDLYDAVEKT